MNIPSVHYMNSIFVVSFLHDTVYMQYGIFPEARYMTMSPTPLTRGTGLFNHSDFFGAHNNFILSVPQCGCAEVFCAA